MRTASALLLLLMACAGSEAPNDAACVDGCDEPRLLREPPTSSPFTLYVSNQSFELPVVDIQIDIDGEPAITGDFPVGSQHSWYDFALELAPGRHEIGLRSAAGEFEQVEVVDLADEERWGIVDFWLSDEENPGYLDWSALDSQPYFD